MKPECSLVRAQKTVTDRYSELDDSISHPNSLRSILILYYHIRLDLRNGVSNQVSGLKFCINL